MEIQKHAQNWLHRLANRVAFSPQVIGADFQPLATTWKTRKVESSLSDRIMHQCITSARNGETTVTVAGGLCSRRSLRCNDVFERIGTSGPFKCVNRAAEWSPRHSFSYLSSPRGELVYVIGGDDGAIRSDVWVSTDRSLSFKRACDEAPWKGRIDFSVALVGDSIVLCGGRIPHRGGLEVLLNDVWISGDRGQTWDQACVEAPWKRRAGSAMIAIGSNLLMLGGQGDVTVFDDAWVSDDLGSSWRPASSRRIPWKGRRLPKVVVDPISNEILLIGGIGSEGQPLTDSWASVDGGISWMPRHHLPDSVVPHATVATTNDGAVFVLGTKAESESVSDLRFVKKDCLFLLMVGRRLEASIAKDLWVGKILPYAVDTRQLWHREQVAWNRIHRSN